MAPFAGGRAAVPGVLDRLGVHVDDLRVREPAHAEGLLRDAHGTRPEPSLVAAPQGEQHVGLALEQPGREGVAAPPVQFRDLQGLMGTLEVAGVLADAGDDHGQLGPRRPVQTRGIHLGGQLQGLLRAAEGTLAVHLRGDVGVVARHAPVGAELAQRVGVLPRRVGGERDCLAHA